MGEAGQKTFLNGEDVSKAIRTPEVGAGASTIGAVGFVREVLTKQVRRIAAELSVVVDGRDVGTAMLPNADVKFFLTAKPEERAERRRKEQEAKGLHESFEQVLAGIQKRDYDDSHRAIAPLKQAEDAAVSYTHLDVYKRQATVSYRGNGNGAKGQRSICRVDRCVFA